MLSSQKHNIYRSKGMQNCKQAMLMCRRTHFGWFKCLHNANPYSKPVALPSLCLHCCNQLIKFGRFNRLTPCMCIMTACIFVCEFTMIFHCMYRKTQRLDVLPSQVFCWRTRQPGDLVGLRSAWGFRRDRGLLVTLHISTTSPDRKSPRFRL